MALLQETGTGNYQSDRERKRLFDEVCDGIFRQLRGLPAGEGRELLAGVRRALEEEIAGEQRSQREFGALREELLRAASPAELARLHRELAGLAADSFRRRESVPAFHLLCTDLFDVVLSQALRLAEGELARAGRGEAPRYAWLVLGAPGRRETPTTAELEGLIVHAQGAGASGYCAALAARAVAILEGCGYRKSCRGIIPDEPAWCASPAEWRVRLEELCRRSPAPRTGALSALPGIRLDDIFSHRTTHLSTPLFELADLRFAAGDAALGEELIAQVRAAAVRHPACIQEAAYSVAALPTPFTFLGKYRVERSGPHRGMLDLNRWACLPLVSMVRHQAVTGGIAETGTLERIRVLLRRGTLDVALGKRLLQGGLEIFRLMARLDVQEGAGERDRGWLSPDSLSTSDEHALRDALEAVATLQKVIHSSLAEKG